MPVPFRPVSSGRPLESLRTTAFDITEASYPAHRVIPPHGHHAATLTFVLRGRLREELGQSSEDLGPRGLLLKPAGTIHSNRFGTQGARLLLVEVLPALHDMLGRAGQVLDRVSPARSRRAAVVMRRIHHELRTQDEYATLTVDGLLLELLAELARAARPRTDALAPYLGRVRDRLQAEFRQPPRLTDLAASEGVPAARLAREFRSRFGVGIGEYQRKARLEWVAGALLETGAALATIAADAGFADQSHMTRDFRAAYGTTPAAFRAAG